MGYTIIVNSSSDLPQEIIEKFNLRLLPLKFMIEDKTYVNYLDHREYDINKFYNDLRDGALATTSQINSYEYQEAIDEEIKKGNDVLILSFSSALSGSYNAARLAVDEYANNKKKVLLIDTKAASLGEGLIIYLAALEKEKGKSIDEVYNFVNNLIPHLAHWFTVDDLMFLRRGGRVSGASAVIGSILRVKPVLHVDDEGRLIPKEKTLGRKKSLLKLVDKLEKTVDSNISNIVFISHGDDLDAANFVKEEIEKLNLGLEIKIVNHIGPVIGAHSGPGTVALFFAASQR